jgi:hypothetical protein
MRGRIDTYLNRGILLDLLRRAPPDNKSVLLVLDGLDEAAGWEAGPDLFPHVPVRHLKCLVAAPPYAGDTDSNNGWQRRLGWQRENVHLFSLAGLTKTGVQDVLNNVGVRSIEPELKIDLAAEIHRLSDGDPLLIRLYVDQLSSSRSSQSFRLDALQKIKPGLDAFFETWFEDQIRLWGQRRPLKERSVRTLLNICATAFGPVSHADIIHLAPDIYDDSQMVEDAADDLRRFLVGDGRRQGQGYVFSHPRLRQYFEDRLLEGSQASVWQQRFSAYMRNVLNALGTGRLSPVEVPQYLVRYGSTHLVLSGRPVEDFEPLLAESWLRASESLDGTVTCYLADVERVWELAKTQGISGTGTQLACSLIVASIVSLEESIEPSLLLACAQDQAVNARVLIAQARRLRDRIDRAFTLMDLAAFVDEEEAEELRKEALYEAEERQIRWRFVLSYPALFHAEEKEKALDEGLEETRKIDNSRWRARTLVTFAVALQGERRESVIAEMLSTALLRRDPLVVSAGARCGSGPTLTDRRRQTAARQ